MNKNGRMIEQKWEEMVCPSCGADGIVRRAILREPKYPETADAPIFCQVCGWDGRAADGVPEKNR